MKSELKGGVRSGQGGAARADSWALKRGHGAMLGISADNMDAERGASPERGSGSDTESPIDYDSVVVHRPQGQCRQSIVSMKHVDCLMIFFVTISRKTWRRCRCVRATCRPHWRRIPANA